jgi:hypothetical protein
MEFWEDELEAIEKYERAVARRKYLGSASACLRVLVQRTPTPDETAEHERLVSLAQPELVIEHVLIRTDWSRAERPGPAYRYLGRLRP